MLSSQSFLVLDGAMATELEALGADLNDPLWSAKILLEAPDLIKKVHTDYLIAGADILSTVTYQATYAGFFNRGISRDAADRLFQESVRLAASARKTFWDNVPNRAGRTFPLIAASIGPYGAFLADGSEYHGHYGLSRVELKDWHRPQLSILASLPEVDFLLFETIPSLLEAQAIMDLMKEFPTVAYSLSFSCRDGIHLCDGTTFEQAVVQVSEEPAIIAVGINCTAPEFVGSLLGSVQNQHHSKPLMVYPNSGEVWDARAHCWKMPDQLMVIQDQVVTWYEAGARIIGGCCRTTPGQIARIRKSMPNLFESL